MKTKSIHYAYPSSPFATKYGYGKTGCYYLEISDDANYDPDKGEVVMTNHYKKLLLAESLCCTLPWGNYSLYNDIDGWKDK